MLGECREEGGGSNQGRRAGVIRERRAGVIRERKEGGRAGFAGTVWPAWARRLCRARPAQAPHLEGTSRFITGLHVRGSCLHCRLQHLVLDSRHGDDAPPRKGKHDRPGFGHLSAAPVHSRSNSGCCSVGVVRQRLNDEPCAAGAVALVHHLGGGARGRGMARAGAAAWQLLRPGTPCSSSRTTTTDLCETGSAGLVGLGNVAGDDVIGQAGQFCLLHHLLEPHVDVQVGAAGLCCLGDELAQLWHTVTIKGSRE